MQLQVAPTAEMKNKANVRSQNLATFPFSALFSLLSKAQGASETRIRLPKTKMTISEPSFKLANLKKLSVAYSTLFKE